MVVGGGCPRATLKWLLSLDLSLPIKQVRRDFSNGFLFAEVFHKFFPSEVSLHSYDTGSSLARKKDNWRLLQKVFKVRFGSHSNHTLARALYHRPRPCPLPTPSTRTLLSFAPSHLGA